MNMKTKTTNELMETLGVSRRSVARIASREKLERLRNGENGQHVYQVSDTQIKIYEDRVIQSPEDQLRMQIESTGYLIGLIDRRISPVSF